MKTFLKFSFSCTIIAFILLLSPDVSPQIKISGGGGYLVHVSGSSNDEYDYWEEKKHQDISHFFADDYAFSASISYRFSPFEKDTLYAFFAGFEYMNAISNSTSSYYEFLLGQQLTINSYTPFIGAGYIPRLKNRNVFIYVLAGIAVKQYEGKASFDEVNVDEGYKTEVVPRIGFGIEYIFSKQFPFALGFEAAFDIGDVTRDDINVSYSGTKVATMHPTGQIDLPDKSIFYKLTVGYLINL